MSEKSSSLREVVEGLAEVAFGMTPKKAWRNGICIDCKKEVDIKALTEAEMKEYYISAVCPKCFEKIVA